MTRNQRGSFNPKPVYIPNRSTREEDREQPRSGISAFGADMDTGRMTRYAGDGRGNTMSATAYAQTPSQEVYQQYGNLIQQGARRKQQAAVEAKRQRDLSDASLASAMVYTRQNGGFMPTEVTEDLSARMGIPIVGGNFTDDGQFILYGRKELRSPNGMVYGDRIEPIAVATPEMQYGLLKRTGLGADMQQDIYNNLSKRFTPKQLAEHGITSPVSAIPSKDALAYAKEQFSQSKQMLDARQTQLKYLMDRYNKLSESGTADPKVLRNLEEQIGLMEQDVNLSLGGNIGTWAAALGVKRVGGNAGTGGDGGANPAGYKIKKSATRRTPDGGKVFSAESTVESDGVEKPRVEFDTDTGEYIVNTKNEQEDGTYQIRVKEGRAHRGEKWVTYVENGEVKRRPVNQDDTFVEQREDGIYLKSKNKKGKTVEIFVPVGKVIRTPFGVQKLSGEKGEYTLVNTNEKPNFSAREAILAAWANRDIDKTKAAASKARAHRYENSAKMADKVYRDENPFKAALLDMAHGAYAAGGGVVGENVIGGSGRNSVAKFAPKRSTANAGRRKRMFSPSKVNEKLDEVVREAIGE